MNTIILGAMFGVVVVAAWSIDATIERVGRSIQAKLDEILSEIQNRSE